MSKYDISEEPIVISKPTLDIFLKQEKPGDLIALYLFYYYTAKWQKTNQPKCTTGYVAKGLKWTEERVQRTKRVLISLELIEDLTSRNSGNRITGHYIKVNFIWVHEKTKDFHPPEIPAPGNSLPLEMLGGNALSDSSINALSDNKENIYIGQNEKSIVNRSKKTNTSIEQPSADNKKTKTDNTRYIPLAEQLAAVLKEKQNITTPPSHITKWANDIRLACEERKINPAKLKRDLQIYADNFTADFRPIIESGKSLREKLPKLWSFIERCQNPKQFTQSKPSHAINFPLENPARFQGRKSKEVSQ